MAIDITDDYLIFDNSEAVTLTMSRKPSDKTATLSNALRGRVPSLNEPRRFAGGLMTGKLTFFLPADQITEDQAAESPQPGDTITDGSSNVYTIETLSQISMSNSVSGYRCIVTPER